MVVRLPVTPSIVSSSGKMCTLFPFGISGEYFQYKFCLLKMLSVKNVADINLIRINLIKLGYLRFVIIF